MLWTRSDLATLRSFATGHTPVGLGDGGPTKPERWTLQFPSAEPPRLKDGTLKRTYTVKPLVSPFGKPVFGELGFFDVFAWREMHFLFVEYKGKGDRSNANERSWIEAAIRCGIDLGQLLILECS